MTSIILVLLLLGAAALTLAADERRIKLTVSERLGIPRTRECVRSGIPFPKGALHPNDGIAVSGIEGDVPVASRPLAAWDDGSVSWLLVNFPCSTAASETRYYTLHYRPDVVQERRLNLESTAGLRVEEDEDEFRVDTGVLRFSILKNRFGVLRNTAVINERSEWVCLSEDGPRFAARNYNYRDYVSDHPECRYAAACEELSSVHAVFCIRGTLVRAAKRVVNGSLDYVCRVYCSAESPSVKVVFTLQNRQKEQMEVLRSIDVVLQTTGITQRASAGWEDGAVKSFDMSSGSGVRVLQTGPTNPTPWEEFECKLLDAGSGMLIDTCGKSAGWAGIEGAGGGVCAAIRRFWEKHPKGFKLEQGVLTVSLHPIGAGNFVFPRGMDCTNDVLLTFHASGRAADAQNASAGFRDPLFACAEPEWYCSSGGMGWLSPVDDADFARYEKLVRDSFAGLVETQKSEKNYGAVDFGDTSGDYSTQPDYWLNQEYDTPHCCYLLFARSGDLDYLRWGEDAVRHQMDIDTIHYCPESREVEGCQYKHEWAHTSYRSYNSDAFKDTVCHTWAEGICDHYLITGDVRALEVACEVGDYYLRKFSRDLGSSSPRQYGWPLIALCRIYEASGERKYMECASEVVRQVLARRHPTRGIWQNSWGVDENGTEILGNKIFMVGILMEGMAFYHKHTQDREVEEWLVKTARTICEEGWVEKDKGFYYTPSPGDRNKGRTTDLRELIGLIYAYVLDPQPLFLRTAQKSFDAGTDACLESAVDHRVSGKQFSTLTRSTPRFAALIRKIGAWKNDRPA